VLTLTIARTGMDVFDIVILEFDRTAADSPAAGLQRVFPIDQGTALRLLNAMPVTVKRGVPQAAAEQYRSALSAIGARVELRKVEAPQAPQAPPPEQSAAAPNATLRAGHAATLVAPPRFAGAGTLKQGSPIDPASVASAAQRSLDPAYLPTDRPPPPSTAAEVTASVPTPAAGAAAASGEQWGGLLSAPKPDAFAGTMVAASPASEREDNRRELFRRLLDPGKPEPSQRSAAEAAGGISMLELDLPSPRAGWAGLAAPAAPLPDAAAAVALDDAGAVSLATLDLAAAPPAPRVQVIAPPRDVRSFSEALPDAMALSVRDGGARWVLLGGGVALAATVLLWLLRGHATLATCVGLLAATVMLAIASEQTAATLRAVVDDHGSPDGPDLRATDLGRYASAGFNLLCFGLATQLPFLSWLSSHREQLPGAFVSAPLGLLMLAVSASYWPIAVGLQAITETPTAVWSMSRGLRAIRIAPADYATLVFAFAVTALLPIALTLLLIRVGLPAELTFFGFGVGMSLSHGAIGGLIGHIGRLHPRIFVDD